MKRDGIGPDTHTYPRATEFIVVIIGGLLVALGITYQSAVAVGGRRPSVFDEIIAGVLIAVGGGVLGAGLNTLIVRRFEHDLLDETRDVIAKSLRAQFLSNDREIARFHGEWHHYHLSELDQQPRWWYQRLSFSNNPAVGSVSERATLFGADGEPHTYLTELGVRGQRLILIATREDDSEASAVEVFPMPRGYQSAHAGIGILETWDTAQMIGKAVLCRRPLIPGLAEGVVPDQHFGNLEAIWVKDFGRHLRVQLGGSATVPGS